jgi:hypothetical protein
VNIYLMKKPKRVNAVSVTITIIALIIAYTGWFLVPAFWPIFQVTGMMRGACNDAYKIYDDEKVMAKLMKEVPRAKLRMTKENFRLTRVPYTEEELDAAVKDKGEKVREFYQKRGKTCVLEMIYKDSYEWPLIGKTTDFTFERKVETELEQVQWEKSCTCVTAER